MTRPGALPPVQSAALSPLRNFEGLSYCHGRLESWLGCLLATLLGMAVYSRPSDPDFLTFSCASGASLSPRVAGVDGRGVCNAPVDGPGGAA